MLGHRIFGYLVMCRTSFRQMRSDRAPKVSGDGGSGGAIRPGKTKRQGGWGTARQGPACPARLDHGRYDFAKWSGRAFHHDQPQGHHIRNASVWGRGGFPVGRMPLLGKKKFFPSTPQSRITFRKAQERPINLNFISQWDDIILYTPLHQMTFQCNPLTSISISP